MDMTQEQINAIAEAIKYEHDADMASVDATLAITRVAVRIALKLKMLDQAFATEAFYTACGIKA